MIEISGNTKKYIMIATAAFLFAGLLKTTDSLSPQPISAVLFLLTNLIYIGLVIAWRVSIERRLLQKSVQHSLSAVCALMVLWILLRACKYRYFEPLDTALRYLWYGYYIPQLFAPVFGLYAVLCLGRVETYRPSKAWYLLFLPAATLCSLILSNDAHQLAFRFQHQFVDWSGTYNHGPVYFLSMMWMIGMIVASAVVLVRKSKLPGGKRRLWIPILLFLAGISLCLWNFLGEFRVFQLPELFCVTYAATWEACIQVGLVSSNTNYRDFFSVSTVAAQIADTYGNVKYRAQAAALSQTDMARAHGGAVLLDADTRLNEHPIHGGHVYWLVSVAAVRRMKDELAETRALLTEEVELTRAENELKAQRARVEEQNRIYDRIADMMRPQLARMDELLTDLKTDSPEHRRKLKLTCVLGAYVKRRLNLMLIAEKTASLSSAELYYCLRESAEYLSVDGTLCECVNGTGDAFPAAKIFLAYDFFQASVEYALPSITSLLVKIDAMNGTLTLRLVMEDAASTLADDWRKDELTQMGGSFGAQFQDGTLFYTLRIRKGGDAA